MSKKVIKICPSCGEKMVINSIGCKNCGIVITGEFDIPDETSGGLNLTADELEFLKLFVKCEGNISKLSDILNMGYFSVKNRLKELSVKLGNEPEPEAVPRKEIVMAEGKGTASKQIISKLNASGGSAECRMLRGDPLTIWLTEDGVGNSGYPDLICEWAVFDAIVEKARELGGIMYRGDSAAQNGAKIGSKELPLDTIDAYISVEFYGNQIGKATIRRSTYYAAILAWAGICTNNRSGGLGGFIRLLPEWKC